LNDEGAEAETKVIYENIIADRFCNLNLNVQYQSFTTTGQAEALSNWALGTKKAVGQACPPIAEAMGGLWCADYREGKGQNMING